MMIPAGCQDARSRGGAPSNDAVSLGGENERYERRSGFRNGRDTA